MLPPREKSGAKKVVWRAVPFHGGVRHHECLGGWLARAARFFR